MSIFQIKEWWSVTAGNNEEFDKNSICVGKFDLSKPDENRIALGSFEGFLRVYCPDGSRKFKMEDMILEENLKLPILQVNCGKFCSATQMSIGILHSRKFTCYALTSQESYATLEQQYEHNIDRNAYNFISGNFGGSQKTQICVQSVDGALFFFQDDLILFQVQLPDFLIPGPLIYAQQIDCLVVTNTNLELECHRFQSLQAGTNNNINQQKAAQAQENSQKAKIETVWTCNLGEMTYHLYYHQNQISKKFDIVAVCDNTFFVINENGKIRYQRRLEYTPSCIKVYHLPNANDIFENQDRSTSIVQAQAKNNAHDSPCFSYIMGSFSHYLMVYKDIQLVWTAKTFAAPIYVNIAKFKSIDGLIVTLSDKGLLQVAYLGTETPRGSQAFNANEGKELNYQQMDMEHQKLLARIRSYEDEKQVEPVDNLVASPFLSSQIEASREYVDDPTNQLARTFQGDLLRMKLKITLSYKAMQGGESGAVFKNVHLHLDVPNSVYTEQTMFKYDQLNFRGRNTPPALQIYLHPITKTLAIDNKITVSVTSSQQLNEGQGGLLRTSQQEIFLPLSFYVSMVPFQEIKEVSDAKINLILNKPSPSATSLFQDVIESLQAQEFTTNKKQIGFMYHNRVPVGLLISKDDVKIRLQSSDFASLWYILKELIKRLNDIFGNQDDFEIVFPDAIPLNELFIQIDTHFQIRQSIEKLTKVLNDRSYQFRVIQKRMLNRFKDKNPSPLNNLDFLLNHTYNQIIEVSNQIDENKKNLKEVSARLSSSLEIILILMKIRFKMTEEEYQLLRMHLNPQIDDENEHGWEETTNAAMTSLLKTCLSKSSGAASSQANNIASQIKTLSDTNKLKQHITLVCDRISKGQKVEI